jgi:hypothetical protein
MFSKRAIAQGDALDPRGGSRHGLSDWFWRWIAEKIYAVQVSCDCSQSL